MVVFFWDTHPHHHPGAAAAAARLPRTTFCFADFIAHAFITDAVRFPIPLLPVARMVEPLHLPAHRRTLPLTAARWRDRFCLCAEHAPYRTLRDSYLHLILPSVCGPIAARLKFPLPRRTHPHLLLPHRHFWGSLTFTSVVACTSCVHCSPLALHLPHWMCACVTFCTDTLPPPPHHTPHFPTHGFCRFI